MSLPKITDLKELKDSEITKKLEEVERELFDLRRKKATRQQFKSHEIKACKRQIAQILTLQRQRNVEFLLHLGAL